MNVTLLLHFGSLTVMEGFYNALKQIKEPSKWQ